MARGEVPGAFWALMTHARSDQSVLAQAYKDVHMLSHQVGAGGRSGLKRLTETRTELETLKRDFDTLQSRTRRQADDREERLRQLERTLALREAELTRLVERERDLTGRLAAAAGVGPAQRIAELELRLAELTDRLSLGERESACRRSAEAEAQRRAHELDLALSEKQAECEALERLLSDNLAETPVGGLSESSADRLELEGPRYADLAGRLVLCVGGRLPHVREFNRLVTRCNGRFDHHDGGLEDGDHRLESLLACADAVVCATDFVSHSAYHRTKRYCKRHEKPHVLLQRSGLSAFARALATVAN
jgi:hypothetical protein